MKILPRLSGQQVAWIVEALEREQVPLQEMPEVVRGLGHVPVWNAAGGERLEPDGEELQSLRKEVLTLARQAGYPERCETRPFDVECTILLATHPLLQEVGGEALRRDCWSGITCLVFPDVAAWRFGLNVERFRGGIRNAFQRLWLRGSILDRGEETEEERWVHVREMTEDALVALLERPGIAADARVSKAIADRWVAWSRRVEGGMEALFRAVMKKISAANEVRLLASLDDQQLERWLEDAFRQVHELQMGLAAAE